jgi:uncharacterized protein YgbK (DUF1537 family)
VAAVAAVAAVAGAGRDRPTAGAPAPGLPPGGREETILVVAGSRHPVTLAQLEALEGARGRDRARHVEVIRPPRPAGGRVAPPDAELVAAQLGEAAHRRLAAGDVGTLVLIGGAPAAAVLGDEPRLVGGTLARGMPWSRRVDGSGPLVITKAGGFGRPTTLVELLLGRPGSEA